MNGAKRAVIAGAVAAVAIGMLTSPPTPEPVQQPTEVQMQVPEMLPKQEAWDDERTQDV